MSSNKNLAILIISLLLTEFSITKDISTFSNYEIIKQTNIELYFNVNFAKKILEGVVKTYFNALNDGEVIVLDTKALKIISVIDSDTGEELEYIIDKQYELEALGIPLKIYKDFKKISIYVYTRRNHIK